MVSFWYSLGCSSINPRSNNAYGRVRGRSWQNIFKIFRLSFDQKSKFVLKIEILTNNRNFYQRSKF